MRREKERPKREFSDDFFSLFRTKMRCRRGPHNQAPSQAPHTTPPVPSRIVVRSPSVGADAPGGPSARLCDSSETTAYKYIGLLEQRAAICR